MARRGKKYRESVKTYDKQELFDMEPAIDLSLIHI